MNTQVRNLKTGDIVSETQYYKVVNNVHRTIAGGYVDFTNERKQPLRIAQNIIEEGTFSASQYEEEKKVTATELAEIFSQVGDTVFEVSFNKLPQAKDVNEAINGLNDGKFPTRKEIKDVVTKVYDGQPRILRGYLIKIESLMGRAKVVDLDIKFDETSDLGYRLVDLRTLNYLIYKGVKYVLK